MQPFYPTLSYNYAPPLDYGGGRCAVDYHCHIDVDFVFFYVYNAVAFAPGQVFYWFMYLH